MTCFPLCSVQVIQSDFARLQAETEAAEEAAKAEYEEFMEDSQVHWKLDFGGFKRWKLIGFVAKKYFVWWRVVACFGKIQCLSWWLGKIFCQLWRFSMSKVTCRLAFGWWTWMDMEHALTPKPLVNFMGPLCRWTKPPKARLRNTRLARSKPRRRSAKMWKKGQAA